MSTIIGIPISLLFLNTVNSFSLPAQVIETVDGRFYLQQLDPKRGNGYQYRGDYEHEHPPSKEYQHDDAQNWRQPIRYGDAQDDMHHHEIHINKKPHDTALADNEHDNIHICDWGEWSEMSKCTIIPGGCKRFRTKFPIEDNNCPRYRIYSLSCDCADASIQGFKESLTGKWHPGFHIGKIRRLTRPGSEIFQAT